MKRLQCVSIASLARTLLSNKNINSATLTSYTVDEGELWRVAFALGLHNENALRLRYDPAGFRAWGEERIVSPAWLQPCQSSESAQKTKRRLPPIYHPKIAVLEADGQACVIISTGNIAESDQCHTANVQCGFVVTQAIAKRIRRWMLAPHPSQTLCLVVREGHGAKLEITNDSAWGVFRNYRDAFAADEERWQLASPFWSTSGLAITNSSSRVHVDAFFRDQAQAQLVASSQAGAWLTCHVPHGKKSFHQKVVAWKGRRGRKTSSIVYVGSANLTSAGFVGNPSGTGCNWEAGVILVGGDDVWSIGRSAARGGIAKWRKVKLRADGPSVANEIGPDCVEDLLGRLQIHLSRSLRVTGQMVRLLDLGSPVDAKLERATLHADKCQYSLKPGQSRRVLINARRVFVDALYRCGNGSCIHANVELPKLTLKPSEPQQGTAIRHIKSMLYAHAYPGADLEETGGSHESDVSESASRNDDVRFPYQALLACHRRNPEFARAWLLSIESGSVPVAPFWKITAKHLLRHHII